MTGKTKILIVEDQPDIRGALSEHLTRNGFDPTAVEDAQQARLKLQGQAVDLVLLDIMMPGEDGLSLCRFISGNTNIPVILLTALTDDMDKIVGLELGADDYVTKPFNPRELVARIRSVLRRAGSDKPKSQDFLAKIGDWVFNKKHGELIGEDDIIVPLSTGELGLLNVFVDNPDTVLSREDLMGLTKGRDLFPFERSIDNMVSRLRRKLERDPANPILIKTVWGGGYKYVPH